MAVLFACICRKDGTVLIARTFFDIPKTRIEGLVGTFSKLLLSSNSNSTSTSTPATTTTTTTTEQQHTFVEGETVRYLYSPLDAFGYLLLLVTDKLSDCLQDVHTLQLCTSAISEQLLTAASTETGEHEAAVSERKFEILFAFDEIALEGRANSMLCTGDLAKILSMESQDEIIQNAIDERKEKEAKEHAKLKMKQIDLQKREAAKRAAKGTAGMDFLPSKPAAMQQHVETVNAAAHKAQPILAPSTTKGLKLGKGMKVAATAKTDLLMQQQQIQEKPLPTRPKQQQPIAIEITELISACINQSTGIESFEVKGTLSLCVVDEAFANISLSLLQPLTLGKAFQLKPHPNIDKQLLAPGPNGSVIAMAEAGKPFPLNQSLGLLKWKYSSTSDALLPLSFTCWPAFREESEEIEVSLEYEACNVEVLPIHNVLVQIPTPPECTLHVVSVDGTYNFNREDCALEWEIALIDSRKASGSFSFRLKGQATSVQQVFPIGVAFEMQASVLGVGVGDVVLLQSGETVGERECEKRVLVKSERFVIENN